MKATTKIFVGLCVFAAIISVGVFQNIVTEWQNRKHFSGCWIDTTPEYVGRFDKIIYDRFYGTYEGYDTSMDYICGFSMIEYPNKVIHADFRPDQLSHGDSIWVVRNIVFKKPPTENEVREYLLNNTRTYTWNVIYASLWVVLMSVCLWRIWVFLQKL